MLSILTTNVRALLWNKNQKSFSIASFKVVVQLCAILAVLLSFFLDLAIGIVLLSFYVFYICRKQIQFCVDLLNTDFSIGENLISDLENN